VVDATEVKKTTVAVLGAFCTHNVRIFRETVCNQTRGEPAMLLSKERTGIDVP